MSNPHILVVDDEADIRGLLKEILSEEGYEVDVAANAAQARASRARQVPDLVLLDVHLPDQSGLEAHQRIRQIDGRIPVIFITWAADADTVNQMSL